MGARGPIGKPANQRQRRNKAPEPTQLPTPEQSVDNEVPDLPPRPEGEAWHPLVVEWWSSIWRSPMASEYLGADLKGGLYSLADLYHERWNAQSPTHKTRLAGEIRLQEVRFGLSPMDRSRLKWEVAKGEEAEQRRTSRKKPEAPKGPVTDPRSVLRAM